MKTAAVDTQHWRRRGKLEELNGFTVTNIVTGKI